MPLRPIISNMKNDFSFITIEKYMAVLLGGTGDGRGRIT